MSENKLRISAELIDTQVRFRARVLGKPAVLVDYVPPYGKGEDHTSLELLLISLGTCLASTVKLMLTNHLKARVDNVRVVASGVRKTSHPTTFESIDLTLMIDAPDLDQAAYDETVERAKQTFCPVLATLNPEIPVRLTHLLKEDGF